MANKRRGGLTTVMDIAMAGVLALVPVAVVGSWWVGALVFGIGVMWVLRPKDPEVISAQKGMTLEEERDSLYEWSDEVDMSIINSEFHPLGMRDTRD